MNTSHGQIQLGSSFCQEIRKLISNNNFETILEIGTWKGMGSTYCVIQEIIDKNINFLSLESYKEFYEIAKNNLSSFKNNVTLLYGRIIELDEFLEFNKDIKQQLTHQQKIFFDNDVKTYNVCPYIMEKIPEQIDFLILDGGEYSTYLEWTKLKERISYVALDDTKMRKTKRIVEECMLDDSFELITSSGERNGFHVFKKIK